MIKILFLCHGNICRSPMAEYIMKKMITDAGLEDKVSVASRALHRDEIGNGVYPPARKFLNEAGIDCSAHHATLMKASDYNDYDYIIVMDDANVRDVMRLSGGDPDGKVYKLLQFEIASKNNQTGNFVTVSDITEAPDVADPWYTRNFDITWRDVNEGCKALLYKIALEIFPHSEGPISNEGMRKADAYTIKNFVSSLELMRRAGRSIAEEIFKRNLVDSSSLVGILCGKGNNAGDGLVAALEFAEKGIPCDIILTADSFSEDAKYYFEECEKSRINIIVASELEGDYSRYTLILDCLFGTGFSGEVREPYKSIITQVNEWRNADSNRKVISADINSGLNGNTGEGDIYIESDLTIAIGSYKYGHFNGNADIAMKEKVCVDIGIVVKG